MDLAFNKHGLYDIYPIRSLPFWQTTWFFLAMCTVVSIVVMALVMGAVCWYRARRAQKKLTAWEQALADLSTIANEAQAPIFYARMTHIVKSYMQNRYGLSAPSKTDDELLILLVQAQFNERYIQMLREIAQEAVLAKFAENNVVPETMQRHHQFCVTFIQETIPTEKMPEA